MSGIVNKVKDMLHHDKSDSTTHTTGATHGYTANSGIGSTGSSGLGSTTHGNATHSGTGVTGTSGLGSGVGSGSTNHGPHSNNLLNKTDPRVDSDLDGRAVHNNTTSGTGFGTSGTSTGTGIGGSNTTAGPHSSNIANRVDPRVDSDLDGSKRVGATGTTGSSGLTGTHAGSHAAENSGLAGTHAGNHTGTHTGTTGGISHSTNAGPHNSNALNSMDPRVDSDLDGRGNRHGASTGGIMGASGSHATAGSGTAQNTAGPHNSDLLNKVDPRVDSDRDGSKTYMGNATHQ